MFAMAEGPMMRDGATAEESEAPAAAPKSEKKTRNRFPETWLWSLHLV